jgi:hypothetical protein
MSGVIYYIILVQRQTINFLSEIVKNHCVALDISFEKKIANMTTNKDS